MESFSIYWDFVKIKMKSAVEYPKAFWLMTLAKMMGWGADLIIIYLMVLRFDAVLGWSAYEMLFLYTLNATAYALAGFFMNHAFTSLPNHIRNGMFDEMLTKPVNPFFYLICKNFSYGYFGNLFALVIAMVVCIVNLQIPLNLLNLFCLLLTVLGGALVHAALFMFCAIPAFWLVKVDGLGEFRSAINGFVRYPISIYDRWIQVLLTFVFPVAFINFFPSQIFIQKSDYLGFFPWFAYCTPLVGLLLFGVGYKLFFFGMKSYSSTGS